ncbi:MAG: hypothetical protein ACO3JL_20605, partial [Myxococcota bacterium]
QRDSDSDGVEDGAEVEAGTDPLAAPMLGDGGPSTPGGDETPTDGETSHIDGGTSVPRGELDGGDEEVGQGGDGGSDAGAMAGQDSGAIAEQDARRGVDAAVAGPGTDGGVLSGGCDCGASTAGGVAPFGLLSLGLWRRRRGRAATPSAAPQRQALPRVG